MAKATPSSITSTTEVAITPQTLEMVNLAVDRDLSLEVRELADQTMAAQTPEVGHMTAWLREWDNPVPSTSLDRIGQARGLSPSACS